LIPVAVAVPLAILTSALQRRISYIQALRDLWKQLLPAIQSAIQYTHLESPQQSDFAKVLTDLSISIDLIRAVFRNVRKPKSRRLKGQVLLYPYENIKDINAVISWLSYGSSHRSFNECQRARRIIIGLWQEMYNEMLQEFDRDVPLKPVSKYLHNGKSIADYLLEGTLADESLKRDYKPSQEYKEK
jgi:hypothetical protein